MGPGAPTFYSPSTTPPFEGNTFEGTSNLKSNYSGMVNSSTFSTPADIYQPTAAAMNGLWPWAGIDAEYITNNFTLPGHISNLTVGTNLAPALNPTAYVNTFSTLANGIVAYNTSVTSFNNVFTSIRENTFDNYNTYISGVPGQDGYNWAYTTTNPASTTNIPIYGNGIISAMLTPPNGGFINYMPEISLVVTGGYPATPYNTFTDCYNGIVAYRLNTVNVTNNLFNEYNYVGQGNVGVNITRSVSSPTLMVQTNVMDLSGFGVEMLQNDPVYAANVSFNTINIAGNANGGTGINVQEGNNPPVSESFYQDNVITLTSNWAGDGMEFGSATGITCNDNFIYLNSSSTNTAYINGNGIFFGYCLNNFCGYNKVVGLAAQVTDLLPFVGLQDNVGVGICAYQSTNSTYQCNTVEDLNIGMDFDAPCNPSIVQGNNFNDPITGGTSNVGLYYDAYAVVNQQTDRGNLWFGGAGGYNQDGAFINPPVGPGAGQYFTPHAGNYWPPSISPAGWFQNATGPGCGEYVCGGCAGAPVTDSGITKFDRDVIDDSVLYSQYNTQLCWVIAKSLYEQIMNDTALLDTGTDVQAFYTAKKNGATGAIVRLEQLEQTALKPDSATAAFLATVQYSMAGIQITLAQLDSARSALADTGLWAIDSTESALLMGDIDADIKAGTYSTDTALWETIDSFAESLVSSTPDSNTVSTINAAIAGLDSVYALYNATGDSLVTLIDSIRRSRAAIAADSAAVITTSLDIELYYKQAYNIYLSTIAQDAGFDSAQIANLYALAFMCPHKGGAAVWMARSMLTLVVDTT